MGTLTYYDHFAECYKIKPDAPQGLIIQRLGEYEKGNCESIEPVLEEVAKMIESEKMLNVAFNDAKAVSFNEGLEVALEIVNGVKEQFRYRGVMVNDKT